MRRHDAYAKAVGAAFARGNAALVNVISVAVGLATLIEYTGGWIKEVPVVHFAVICFDPHVLWIDFAQMNARADLQRFADRNALPIFVGYLHVGHLNLRPILSDLGFPLAEMRCSIATVAGEILVRLCRRNIELLRIFLDHALRVEDRRDAAN